MADDGGPAFGHGNHEQGGDPGKMTDIPATPQTQWLTESDVLAAHAEHGRLDWHMVKKAMGPNWPATWEQLGPGEAIFMPEEQRP